LPRRRQLNKFGGVPAEVVKLSAAVDVLKTGLFYSIRGWGARATSWQIESNELAGYTNEPEVWSDLANVLLSTYGGMHVALALVDSGFRPDKPGEGPTNVVYDFCSRFRRFVKPTKGYTTLAAPIMRGKGKVTVPGRGLAVQLELVRLDTDFWKSPLYERLAWPVNQPGGFWLSSDATDDYCRQLVSEVRKLTPSAQAAMDLGLAPQSLPRLRGYERSGRASACRAENSARRSTARRLRRRARRRYPIAATGITGGAGGATASNRSARAHGQLGGAFQPHLNEGHHPCWKRSNAGFAGSCGDRPRAARARKGPSCATTRRRIWRRGKRPTTIRIGQRSNRISPWSTAPRSTKRLGPVRRPYRYHRLKQVGGSTSSSPWIHKIYFKCAPGAYAADATCRRGRRCGAARTPTGRGRRRP
jgi:hypothetical protein